MPSSTPREPNGLVMAPPPPTIWHNIKLRGARRSNSGWRTGVGERETTTFDLDGYIRLESESAWQMSEELTHPSRMMLQHGCQMAKFDPFLSLDCARVEGVGAQSKERKGSNFAAQRSGAIVKEPEGPSTYNLKIWL